MKEHEFIKLIQDCDLKAVENALSENVILCNAKFASKSLLGKETLFSALQVATYQLEKLASAKQRLRFQIARKLIDAGADLTFIDSRGFNFLQSNIYLCARKTVDARKHEYQSNSDNLHENARLHYKIIKYILDNANANNVKNQSNAASVNTHFDSVEDFFVNSLNSILIPEHGDLEKRSMTCLNFAVWSGHEELCDLILQYSAKLVRIHGVIAPLHEAIILLLHDEFQPEINLSRYNILKNLLENLQSCGADIKAMIDEKCLQNYQTEANKGVVYDIIGAVKGWSKPTNYNAIGNRPLHSVIACSKPESTLRVPVVKLLLAYHANDTLGDYRERTPLQLAREYKYQDVEDVLLQYTILQGAKAQAPIPPSTPEPPVPPCPPSPPPVMMLHLLSGRMPIIQTPLPVVKNEEPEPQSAKNAQPSDLQRCLKDIFIQLRPKLSQTDQETDSPWSSDDDDNLASNNKQLTHKNNTSASSTSYTAPSNANTSIVGDQTSLGTTSTLNPHPPAPPPMPPKYQPAAETIKLNPRSRPTPGLPNTYTSLVSDSPMMMMLNRQSGRVRVDLQTPLSGWDSDDDNNSENGSKLSLAKK